MSINLTDEIEVKTKKGKLGAAKQIFLEGDQENLQQIGDKTHQLEDAIKDIAVSGGASTANAVSYNNETSGMTAVTAQGAIDELVTKNKSQDAIIAEKAEKSDVQSSVSELKAKNTSQDAEIAKKANTADVTSQMQAEQSRVNTELDKKFDKESILQESGEAEDKVMSQKATTTAIADEVARAKAAEQAILFDVSANNNGAVFESLSDLLSSSNLSTLIPTSVRHGGMSIRFIQSSNNKYVQYLYMGAAITGTHNPFLDEANWQGVDDVKSDISALQKKTLDFIEGSPTKFVEINNSDHFTIKPQTTAYYGGKNFFKFEDIPETTINGITYSVTNGVITLNGTALIVTELPLKAAPISIDSIGQLNMKVWRDGGSVSNNFSFLLFEKPNASGTLLLKAYVYSSFGDSGNISDVESTVETAPNNKGYLFLVAASGISFNNLIIRPMLTLADRYKAGDYSYGKTPIKITNETVVRSAKYCCVQAHTDFSIVSEMAKSDSLQKSIYGMNIKASSGKILKILDGVPFSNLVSADTESVRIKVVGKNLINYKGWFEAITGNPLIYQPIALRPNTTYIFTNKGTDLTHLSGTIQVRYGGITDTTSTSLATILGDENVQELSFTTPNYNGQYYLRYYGNLCAEMREGTHGDFSTMMLVEGDTPLEYFEEYVEGDYLKNSARLSENDISYVYTENLDTVTIKYYSRIGSKGMPYYWQDYMDVKSDISALQKKTLDFIEGSPTKFVEINNSDHFTIKPQTTAYYGGKNFFKFEDIPETTINGITYSVTNGVITLNGTALIVTELPLKAAPISIDSIGQLNMKVWRDGGSVSNNFSFLLFEKPNASGTLLLKAYVYSSFGDSGNISDVESTVETAPNNKGYLFLVAASGISFNNLIIRPMLTLADRYKAGDYSYGKTPIKITNETVVRSAKYCCVQAHTDFSIVSEMAKSDSLQKSIYGMNIKASSGKILKILDGVPFSNLVSADTESVRIKVVGKNLINYKGWFEAITGNPLIYQPIALRPNTTYIFTNKGTDLTHLSGTIQVRYGGITDTTSTSLATILGDENVQELSFTTPNYNGQYYLRYYGNLCAEMREGTHGDFSTMMLVEGDTPLEYFEEYVEGDYLKNSARLSENDISYVYTENLDTVTIKYYSRIGSKGMPYYWQDYMDAKKMDLRKKLLSISMHGLAFSFFTDVHIDENTCNSAYLLDYLRDEVGIPFKVFGGDLLNYSNNEETESIIQYYRFRKLYMNDKDTFCTPGNHDFYSPMARNIFYNILVKPIELLFDTNGYNKIERTYFYIDNSSQKVRMIFLDSNDWDSEKPVMFNWYVEALNSIPNGWDCVIFSHILESGTYFGNDIPFFAKEYNDRTSGSHSLGDGSATITYDFASGTGKVICAIGGHSHKDYSNTDFGFPVILTTTDCVGGITVQHPTVPMTKGTITENAFDVFFINLDAKTIDAIRIGAGEDRHWTY